MKPKFRSLRTFLALSGSSLLATSAAHADVLYWDSNNGTAGFGAAAGTWAAPTNGTTTAGWSTSAAGTTVVNGNSVTTTTFDDLNFGSGLGSLGYAGTITVSGTVDAGNLTTFSNRATNGASGNPITLSGGTAINLAATSIINNVGDDSIVTISTALTGAGTSLTKTGFGTLVLSGTNTFAGQLTVAQGTLSIATINNNSTNGTLGNSANAVILGSTGYNGVLRYTGNADANSDKAFTLATGGTGAFDVTTAIRTLTLNGAVTGSGRLFKTGGGTLSLTSASNGYTGGTVVGAGTLSLGSASSLGTNVNTNNITIRDSGRLLLSASGNTGANQSITLSSSSNNALPVSSTGGGANAGGALAVLGLGYNGLPANISQANTNGGVIAINGVTGYNQDLSTVLSGKNLFLGAIGTSTFTGAAGTVVAGNNNLYRLGGGGGQITFNTTNLFTGTNGVQAGSTSVNGGGTVVISAAQDYTGATTVSGAASATASQNTTLTLSGAGTATGSSGFTLNGGRLFLDSSSTNNSNRIGNVAVTLSNGGELHLSGNSAGTTEAIGNLNIGAGNSTVTVQASTVASTLSGTGFSRTNNGTALFRGTSLGQQTGAVGRLTLSDTSGLSFSAGSTLNNAANDDTTKDVKIISYLVGSTTANGGADSFVTYDDTLGFRVLNTANQFNSTITAGTNVRLTAAATGITTNSINSLIHTAGTSTIADGATLTISSGALLLTGNINQAGTTGILDFGSAQGVITNAGTSIIGARITGSNGLIKSGSGALSLTNVNNSFTGDIIVNGGTLTLGVANNGIFGDAANNIVVNGNATFNTTVGTPTYARGIAINNGAILNFTNNGSVTFSGNVTGTGGVSNGLSGFSSNVTFSGTANTFEGPILIAGQGTGNNEFRMSFASLADSATANGRIVFSVNYATRADASLFEYTGSSNLLLANRQIELASALGSPTFGHQLRSSGTGTLSVSTDLVVSTPVAQTLTLNGTNTGANTFSGKIIDGVGKVSLTKSAAGRWIVSGNNTYTGDTTISAGTLEIGASGVLGGGNYAGNISIANASSGNLNVNSSANQTFSGVISGSGALIKNNTGTLTLSGANTLTGATTINGGILTFANVASKSSGSAVTAAAAGTVGLGVKTADAAYYSATNVGDLFNTNTLSGFNLNASSGVAIDTTNAGGSFDQTVALTGTRALTKLGTGTLILSQANSYTGATTVTGGKLAVNGSITSAVTVQTGATLQGNGSITGAVTVQSGGFLSTGNSIESLTITGNLTQQAGSTFAYEIDNNVALAVAGDLTAVSGDLTITGSTLTLTELGSGSWGVGEKLTLLSYGGTLTGLFTHNSATLVDDSTFDFSGVTWQFNYNDTVAGSNYTGDLLGSNFVTMTVIPEPKAALLGALGVLLLLRRRR